IANGSFHAGRPITGDAGADDRLLLVYRLGGPTRRSLIGATVRHAVLGARRTLKEPAFLAVNELWLHTDPPVPLDVGGEIPPPPAPVSPGAQSARRHGRARFPRPMPGRPPPPGARLLAVASCRVSARPARTGCWQETAAGGDESGPARTSNRQAGRGRPPSRGYEGALWQGMSTSRSGFPAGSRRRPGTSSGCWRTRAGISTSTARECCAGPRPTR